MTTIFECFNLSCPSFLQTELDKICNWFTTKNTKINDQRTKELRRISFLKHESPVQPLTADGHVIDIVPYFKLLGVYISSDLTWSHHVDYICTKASKRLYALRTPKHAGTSSNDLVFCQTDYGVRMPSLALRYH